MGAVSDMQAMDRVARDRAAEMVQQYVGDAVEEIPGFLGVCLQHEADAIGVRYKFMLPDGRTVYVPGPSIAIDELADLSASYQITG